MAQKSPETPTVTREKGITRPKDATPEPTSSESFFEGRSPFGLTFGRLFEDLLGRRMHGDGDSWFAPALDVSEDESSYFVSVELPGMKKEDVKIQIENDLLCISGEKRVEKTGVRRTERRYGAFCRTLGLPPGVDTSAATAEMKDGILQVTFPKKPEAKPKTLTIR